MYITYYDFHRMIQLAEDSSDFFLFTKHMWGNDYRKGHSDSKEVTEDCEPSAVHAK